jgi:DNA repair protein RadD
MDSRNAVFDRPRDEAGRTLVVNLRPYQIDAVASLFEYFEHSDGNPVIVLPTASGKSIIQAAFIQETLAKWPNERFLLLSHVKELLIQNSSKIGPDVGIYSAGLKQRDIKQVTLAGIQSIYKRAHEVGDISIIIIDECHLLSKHSASMYRRFLDDLRGYCPHVKVIGMSATPFRLDSGPLIKGSNRLFTDIAYSISMRDLMDQGYLSPLVSAPVKRNTVDVKKRGGEYIAGDLERAMDKSDITKAALDEVEALCQDRKSWLVFCCGVEHARHVTEELNARGYRSEIVIGDTPSEQRSSAIESFKAGGLRALVSVGVLTTGFDAPCADALICLRPTCSPGLWLQMVGRITRIHPGKENGLVLDFTDNTKNHGPVDRITIDGDGEVKTSPCRICVSCGGLVPQGEIICPNCGDELKKYCAVCMAPMALKDTACPTCGYDPYRPRVAKHNTTASTESIISSLIPKVIEITSWEIARHKKQDRPDSVRVRYWSGIDHYDEWWCFDHGGYAAQKACKWLGQQATTTEAIEVLKSRTPPKSITVRQDGKYWRVLTRNP